METQPTLPDIAVEELARANRLLKMAGDLTKEALAIKAKYSAPKPQKRKPISIRESLGLPPKRERKCRTTK